MLGMSTSLVLIIGLSTSAAFLEALEENHPSNVQQQFACAELAAEAARGPDCLPRFIRLDADLAEHFAASAPLAPAPNPRNILSITSGCPGTGLLDGTFSGSDVYLTASGLPPQVFSLFVYGTPIANPVPFYDGMLCVPWGRMRTSSIQRTSLAGEAIFDDPMQPGLHSNVLSVQCMYRDLTGLYGGNLTDGCLVTYEPLP